MNVIGAEVRLGMLGPAVSPFFVDPSRIGGSITPRRHSFSAPSQEKERLPRWLPPPPRRVLAEGFPGTPRLSSAQLNAIRAKADTAAETLKYELETVKVESDYISGPTLKSSPDLYKRIGLVGTRFTPQAIRSQVMLDAQAIEMAASRLRAGALSSYLAPSTIATLDEVIQDANSLVQYERQFDAVEIGPGETPIADGHVESHVLAANQLIAQAEREAVAAEAGSVPVLEPMERRDKTFQLPRKFTQLLFKVSGHFLSLYDQDLLDARLRKRNEWVVHFLTERAELGNDPDPLTVVVAEGGRQLVEPELLLILVAVPFRFFLLEKQRLVHGLDVGVPHLVVILLVLLLRRLSVRSNGFHVGIVLGFFDLFDVRLHIFLPFVAHPFLSS